MKLYFCEHFNLKCVIILTDYNKLIYGGIILILKTSKFTKQGTLLILMGLFFMLFSIKGIASDNLSPFLGVKVKGNMATVTKTVKEDIKKQKFEIIGEYNVAGNNDLKVIAFTRGDLKKVGASYNDRGALGSVLKVGIKKEKDGAITVSIVNPNYMFNAYFGKGYDKNAKALNKINSDAIAILPGTAKPFGGEVKISKLRKYHYMVGMPYFDDPIKLNTYGNFNDGIATIEKNIKTSSKVKLVYKVIDKDKQTAVFAFALVDPKKGEKQFLPIIGEDQFAALPYEIILEGNTVTMLHGRYRIALYYPGLTMGTFSKIMSTPGNIKDMMESVTK
jgi:hypothetical protein